LPFAGDFYQTLTSSTTIGPDVTGAYPNGFYQGSCPTTTVCWIVGGAIGGGTVAEPVIGGVAQATTVSSNVGQLFGVACSSATSCLAMTSSAIVSITEDDSSGSGAGPSSGSGSGASPTSGSGSGASPSNGSGSGASGSGGGSGAEPGSDSSVTPEIFIARAAQTDGVATVAIDCRDAACSVKLTETIKVKHGKSTKVKIVASKALRLAAGKRAVESLKLNALGVKTLKKAKGTRLKTTLTITMDGKTVSVEALILTADTANQA
jgi:hypothetical protein